jgi:predicted lipoprotein with Yx(FWY)xxD motif
MNSNRPAAAFIPSVLLGLTLAACGGSASSTSGATGASSDNVLIRTASMKVSDKTEIVLKTPNGLTLYYFTPDSSTSPACTGGCATTWPPLLATSGTPTSNPALPGTLSVFSGPNGNQVLYNGHPLYTYTSDKNAGDAYGEGIGGKWFVATPALSAAGASGSPSPTYTRGY